jgi:hypothetical protein
MQTTVLALALGTASAFVAPAAPAAASSLNGAKDDLVAYAESNPDALGAGIGFWDPLGVTGIDFWGLGEEGTIGYLRHAEIKHGRVAMAAFLGFCAGSTDLVSGEHQYLPYTGYVSGCTPQEQWDNIPLYGKLQIFTLIGMLESYGEGAGQPDGYVHYTKGGKPGFFPSIKGQGGGQISLDLWDPFGLPGGPSSQDAAAKERGLKAELNNGRLAQIGILSLLSASKGLIVPPISDMADFPKYAGDVMVPFSNDFSLF